MTEKNPSKKSATKSTDTPPARPVPVRVTVSVATPAASETVIESAEKPMVPGASLSAIASTVLCCVPSARPALGLLSASATVRAPSRRVLFRIGTAIGRLAMPGGKVRVVGGRGR